MPTSCPHHAYIMRRSGLRSQNEDSDHTVQQLNLSIHVTRSKVFNHWCSKIPSNYLSSPVFYSRICHGKTCRMRLGKMRCHGKTHHISDRRISPKCATSSRWHRPPYGWSWDRQDCCSSLSWKPREPSITMSRIDVNEHLLLLYLIINNHIWKTCFVRMGAGRPTPCRRSRSVA